MIDEKKTNAVISQTDYKVGELWEKYKATGSAEMRDKLILSYSPLVKYVASRVAMNLPPNVEQQDLISYGFFGLIDAIDKFQPDRNIKFETYAVSRIRGAIIDELRSLDWMPRSLRSKSKEIERSYIKLESELKRRPTDKELAAELDITEEELDNLLTKLSYGSVIALDELSPARGEKGFDASLINTIEDTSGNDPVTKSEFQETKEIIARTILDLPDKEKTVVSLYYYEGLTMREIGTILGITESRASQLHTKAILYLKAKLNCLYEEV